MLITLLSFTGFLKSAFYIIIALLILLLMITIHEFGHYTFGKLFGFKINEFAIGFGKALFKKTNKKTGEVFSIRILPLGGYCAFEGEEDESEDEGAFYKQKPWKRIIVLFGGVFFNFLSAIIFSVALLMIIGNPLSYQKITSVNSEALQNVMFEGDIITHVNETEISYWDFQTSYSMQLSKIAEGETITLTLVRENGATVKVTVNSPADYSCSPIRETNFFLAFGKAVLFTIALCWLVLVTIGMLFSGKLGIKSVGGPITTVKTMAQVTAFGWQNVLYLIPLLATNLAVFNALPFPALDGSKIVFTGIEWIRKKPINRNVENIIHLSGLIILFAFVIIVDILHFIL